MNADYKNKLLTSWEDVYKKGQLSFWILLSLKEKPRYVDEIKAFIETVTKGTFTCEEQSLYRALRKYYDIEMVDYTTKEGNKGPERKYYFLTDIGKDVLQQFIKRNITIFLDPSIKNLISK